MAIQDGHVKATIGHKRVQPTVDSSGFGKEVAEPGVGGWNLTRQRNRRAEGSLSSFGARHFARAHCFYRVWPGCRHLNHLQTPLW